jgi:hypothetical protein
VLGPVTTPIAPPCLVAYTQKTLYGDFHLGVEFLRVKLVDFAVIRNRAKIQGNWDVSDRRNSNVVETAALARECTATEQDRPVEAPVQGGFNDTQESGRGRTGGRRCETWMRHNHCILEQLAGRLKDQPRISCGIQPFVAAEVLDSTVPTVFAII